MGKCKVDTAWAYLAERRGAYRIFVGKSEASKPLVRTGRSWDDKKKHGCSGSGMVRWDRIDRAQDRDRWRGLVNTVMNLQAT